MENVFVKEGITKKQIQQLINYTNTDEIIKKFDECKNNYGIDLYKDNKDNCMGIFSEYEKCKN